MLVNVQYNSYSTGIASASIEAGEESTFEISLIEDDLNPLIKKLELKSIDSLLGEVSLQMTFEEAKQFNLLMTQFLRQL